MKIELVKNEAKKTVGWTIIGENEQEKRTLGSMRNLLFFGMGKDFIEYDGMSTDQEDDNYVSKLHFATRGHIEEKKEALRAQVVKTFVVVVHRTSEIRIPIEAENATQAVERAKEVVEEQVDWNEENETTKYKVEGSHDNRTL